MRGKTIGVVALGAYVSVVVSMAGATIVEKVTGETGIYTSAWFCALWAILAVSALAYMLKQKMNRRVTVFLLHVSFLLILLGALATHVLSESGRIHVRAGETVTKCETEDGGEIELPFSLRLDSFSIERYAGTVSHRDYVSCITVDGERQIRVSMNKIGEHKTYRLYQSGYDEDERGTYLSMTHDPIGIGLTYAGYGLLAISMLMVLLSKEGGFRRAIREVRRSSVLGALAIGIAMSSCGRVDQLPETVGAADADSICRLMAYHNGRVSPLESVARDVVVKITGKASVGGQTSNQIYVGIMTEPQEWAKAEIIKVSAEVAEILGKTGKKVSYEDFFGRGGDYKLDGELRKIGRGGRGASDKRARSIEEADERVGVFKMLIEGRMTKIFPYKQGGGVAWYSSSDNLPAEMPQDQFIFVRRAMSIVGEEIERGDSERLRYIVGKIAKYQVKEAGGELPSAVRVASERAYLKMSKTKEVGIVTVMASLVLLVWYTVRWAGDKGISKATRVTVSAIVGLLTAYTMGLFVLRWIAGGHVPLANGHETMQFMAIVTLGVTLALSRKFVLIQPFGLLIAGLSMMVSMMGESNPQITNLMPVLSSPLLSLHVCVIMVAYSLLALMMINGVTAMVVGRGGRNEGKVEALGQVSRLMLTPAVFLLTAGIFIGAVWANQSWGRYWGWDPKETWALITMMVYAVPLHGESLPMFRRSRVLHVYLVVAFLSVLMTYFGVYFLLGGLHSYANS